MPSDQRGGGENLRGGGTKSKKAIEHSDTRVDGHLSPSSAQKKKYFLGPDLYKDLEHEEKGGIRPS